MKKLLLSYRLLAVGCWVISLCCSGFVNAQSVGEIYPKSFTQYYHNLAPINPSGIGYENRIELKSLTHFFTNGPFRNVYQTAGYASVRLGDSTSMKHILGLSYQFEKDGGFLNRSRAYLNYGLSRTLFPAITLNVAAAIGGFNYTVVPTNANVGGGDLVLDGKFGMSLLHPNWTVGVSLNQLLDNTITPFDGTFDLPRYPVFYGDYKMNAGLNHVLFRALLESRSDLLQWQASAHYLYYSRIEMGIGLNNYFESIWNIGITEMPLWFTMLDFGIAYTQGLRATSLRTLTQLEIYLFIRP